MKTVKIVRIIRKNNGVIDMYDIQFGNGNMERIKSSYLKDCIKNGMISVDGYKLTADNRLIKSSRDRKTRNKDIKYFIMNRDKAVAYTDSQGNTFTSVMKMPVGYKDFRKWAESRAEFNCVGNRNELFKAMGISSLDDFIAINYCISLRDNFWVKPNGSKLSWDDVSPFKNKYSKMVSTYCIEGNMVEGDGNYYSPISSVSGSYPCMWKFMRGAITMVKAGTTYTIGGCNSGNEPYSEYYASVIAEYLGFKHVEYWIKEYKRTDGKLDIVTECGCYTSEDIGSITALTIGIGSYEELIGYCRRLDLDSYKTCLDMLFLDCLLLNVDRHLNNVEFLVDNKTSRVVSMAPIFDNNSSMLPRFVVGTDTFNRSDYTAYDNRDFDDLYRLILKHKSYCKELSLLKKLVLYKPEGIGIKMNRLKFLNQLLRSQVLHLEKLEKAQGNC